MESIASSEMKEKILIVEDQFIEANNLQLILKRAGYEVCPIARSVPIALEIIEHESPTFVLLDIFLQGPLTGIDLARILRDRNIPFVYLSANSNTEILSAAKATCPYGFLVKPYREKDVLVTLEIAQYLHENSLESLLRSGQNKNKIPSREEPPPSDFFGIIGKSKKLQTTLHHLQIVAPNDTSVLIFGESGTGKERLVDCIHELSPRKNKSLIKVNCGALPVNLIESELFGHEKGAFTGAITKRIGKFEQADKGTLFLDEIGELPLELQVKFLRVLQEKEVERIGSNTSIKVDVRIIAATNLNLEKEVAEGRFRMDLYYRLNVFPLSLPPLRERKEDIGLLAKHFMNQKAIDFKKHVNMIAEKAMEQLLQHEWPGNVRELEHTVERAVLMSDGNTIHAFVMPEGSLQKKSDNKKIKTIEQIEREHIIDVLQQCKGKVSGTGGAANLLGINVSTLNSRIKKLGIEKDGVAS